MGPIGPRGLPGRDGLSTLEVTYFHRARNTSYFQCKFKHYWYGEFVPLLRRITKSCDAISTKCESKHGRHLNMTAKNQLLQAQALERLVENTRQREFDKLFDSIPVYDGEDPEKFEPWLSKLESACLVGKRDVREVAICSSTGPVLEVLNSIEDKEDWRTHRDELRRCFSTNKTRVHAADLLSNFRRQHANENLRSFIHQYTKMHRQATGLKPENDYDLSRKVEFMKRIRNTQIANKIIKSNRFKDYN